MRMGGRLWSGWCCGKKAGERSWTWLCDKLGQMQTFDILYLLLSSNPIPLHFCNEFLAARKELRSNLGWSPWVAEYLYWHAAHTFVCSSAASPWLSLTVPLHRRPANTRLSSWLFSHSASPSIASCLEDAFFHPLYFPYSTHSSTVLHSPVWMFFLYFPGLWTSAVMVSLCFLFLFPPPASITLHPLSWCLLVAL